MSGFFGWSYPAGCSGPPDEDEPVCSACGLGQDEVTGDRMCVDPAACDAKVRAQDQAEAESYAEIEKHGAEWMRQEGRSV